MHYRSINMDVLMDMPRMNETQALVVRQLVIDEIVAFRTKLAAFIDPDVVSVSAQEFDSKEGFTHPIDLTPDEKSFQFGQEGAQGLSAEEESAILAEVTSDG